MEEKAMSSVDSCQFTWGQYNFPTLHCSDLGPMRTPPLAEPAPPAGLLRLLLCRQRSPHATGKSTLWVCAATSGDWDEALGRIKRFPHRSAVIHRR